MSSRPICAKAGGALFKVNADINFTNAKATHSHVLAESVKNKVDPSDLMIHQETKEDDIWGPEGQA